MTNEVLLDIQHAVKHFPVASGTILRRRVGAVRAVDGVSFQVRRGETFGLVGESGCGKTTLGKAVLLLERLTAGRITFRGKDTAALSRKEQSAFRRAVQAVFQDPYSSLDPRMRVRDIVLEPVRAHERLSSTELKKRAVELLEVVGLHRHAADLYPHEFSGGQRQRIAIARALSVQPEFVVLDEPVSALDVSVRSQVINLLRDLQARYQLTYLVIAHDLALVQYFSDRVGVMYLGKLVELADSDSLYAEPLHPYTRLLLSAIPEPDPDARREDSLPDTEVPSPLNPPPGCRFHTRCPLAAERCQKEEPLFAEVRPNHWVACHLAGDV